FPAILPRSLHDALQIWMAFVGVLEGSRDDVDVRGTDREPARTGIAGHFPVADGAQRRHRSFLVHGGAGKPLQRSRVDVQRSGEVDRKSTRLNSSHVKIS